MGGPPATHLTLPQPFQQYGKAYSFGGSAEIHLISLPSLHGGEGSYFLGSAANSDTINSKSVVEINPGDSGMMIGYQVDEFTHTWSVEYLTA